MTTIPDSFLCPISHEIMKDPVIDNYGVSYDRHNIEKWINDKHTCPMNTSLRLELSDLRPNIAIKNQIYDFLKNNNNIAIPTNVSAHVPKINIKSEILNFDDAICVKFTSESDTNRIPVHIVCAVDVSGSMNSPVEIKTENGVESDGLSQLDVTKHALNTIINVLNDNDLMTLISFSTDAEILATSVNMNSIGKKILSGAVENLRPGGTTNIWSALKLALNCINNNTMCNKLSSIFLLTDGVPNVIPPKGHEHMISKELNNMHSKCIINTFGFGYSLNSQLLKNIATLGNGMYSFIPDAGFVGTTFINLLSNQLLTSAISPYINIAYENGDEYTHDLASCKLNMLRNKYIEKSPGKTMKKIITGYIDIFTSKKIVIEERLLDYESIKDEKLIVNEIIRNDVCQLICKLITNENTPMQILENLINQFNNKYKCYLNDKFIKDVLEDVNGQIQMAVLSNEYFTKWGKHYLLSLEMAHDLQLCSNFKDPGLQNYTCELFETTRDNFSDIFDTIPPPRPLYTNTSSTYVPANMANYNNANAPCFAEGCIVATPNGFAHVEDLKIGDYVRSFYGNDVKITHILKTRTMTPVPAIKFSSGLIITPNHPIFNIFENREWQFPKDVKNVQAIDICVDFYDFVIDSDHVIVVNGVPCITLGHNITNNSVLEHDYLGSNLVIDDLNIISNAQNTPGIAEIRSHNIIRDENGYISKFSL